MGAAGSHGAAGLSDRRAAPQKELADTRRSRGLLLGGWALFLLSCVLPSLLWSSQRWFAFFFAALDWGRIALLAALLVLTLRFLRGRRAENTAAC